MAIDWGKLGTSLLDFAKSDAGRATAGGIGALIGATNLGGAKQQPVGYQGGIPNYTATRQKVQETNPVSRRPGSGGQRYFTDTTYTKSGLMPGYPTAEQLAAANAANNEARGAGIAALIAALSGGKNTTPALTVPTTPTPTAPAQPAQSKPMSSEEIAWSKANPVSTTLSPELDSLDELRSYAKNAMSSMGAEGAAIDSGEASSLLSAASALGQSPKQMADMLGVTEAAVINRLKDSYPHLAYNYLQKYGYAEGGIAGRYLGGSTDGMADEIQTSIDAKDPAALSHGEFIVPADVVSGIGNGNSEAGAKVLYDMMDRIRKARTGTTKQGRRIDPHKLLPA